MRDIRGNSKGIDFVIHALDWARLADAAQGSKRERKDKRKRKEKRK